MSRVLLADYLASQALQRELPDVSEIERQRVPAFGWIEWLKRWKP